MLPQLAILYISLFILSSLAIWFGTGLVVDSISSLAKSLNISRFTLSFFVLGLLTSLPEAMIGATALIRGEPEIMVGNLIGATLVIFLLVIPLLAVSGGRVVLPKVMHRPQLAFSLITILVPTVAIADRTLTLVEGIFLVVMYSVLFVTLSQKESFLEKIREKFSTPKRSQHRLPKIIFGLILILASARGIVTSAEFFATSLSWSPFIVGLIIVAIGTNIPELSLVARTVISKKTDIALADYIGSAAGNTLLIGAFTIMSSPILLPNHTIMRFTILLTSLVLFYVFIRSKNNLSRAEGFVLLLIYVIFVVIEIMQV